MPASHPCSTGCSQLCLQLGYNVVLRDLGCIYAEWTQPSLVARDFGQDWESLAVAG